MAKGRPQGRMGRQLGNARHRERSRLGAGKGQRVRIVEAQGRQQLETQRPEGRPKSCYPGRLPRRQDRLPKRARVFHVKVDFPGGQRLVAD